MPKKRPRSASPKPASTQTAEAVARTSFRSGSDPASLRRDVWRWLKGVVWSVVLVPLVFYLRFGEVGALGWGTTVFFAAYCLLAAVGLHFLVRPEYHTPVALRNDWLDRVGMFWLVACAFGPLFGWALAAAFELSAENWRWFYWGRVGLSVGLPVLTALPLLRYVRGRGAPIMLALLLGVTALPVWSAWATMRDLRSEPVSVSAEQASAPCRAAEGYTYLPHTRRVFAKR